MKYFSHSHDNIKFINTFHNTFVLGYNFRVEHKFIELSCVSSLESLTELYKVSIKYYRDCGRRSLHPRFTNVYYHFIPNYPGIMEDIRFCDRVNSCMYRNREFKIVSFSNTINDIDCTEIESPN